MYLFFAVVVFVLDVIAYAAVARVVSIYFIRLTHLLTLSLSLSLYVYMYVYGSRNSV